MLVKPKEDQIQDYENDIIDYDDDYLENSNSHE